MIALKNLVSITKYDKFMLQNEMTTIWRELNTWKSSVHHTIYKTSNTSMLRAELQRLLGMWVPDPSAFETKHFINRTCFITKTSSTMVSSNVSTNLKKLYTNSDIMMGLMALRLVQYYHMSVYFLMKHDKQIWMNIK